MTYNSKFTQAKSGRIKEVPVCLGNPYDPVPYAVYRSPHGRPADQAFGTLKLKNKYFWDLELFLF